MSCPPWSFSPDGRLAYYERSPETGYDLWTLPIDLSGGDQPKVGKPELFLRTPAHQMFRFLAGRTMDRLPI